MVVVGLWKVQIPCMASSVYGTELQISLNFQSLHTATALHCRAFMTMHGLNQGGLPI